MFKKWKYQNQVNTLITDAAEKAFGPPSSAMEVFAYCVDGKIIGVVVDSYYRTRPPFEAAARALEIQAKASLEKGDLVEADKWTKILAAL